MESEITIFYDFHYQLNNVFRRLLEHNNAVADLHIEIFHSALKQFRLWLQASSLLSAESPRGPA